MREGRMPKRTPCRRRSRNTTSCRAQVVFLHLRHALSSRCTGRPAATRTGTPHPVAGAGAPAFRSRSSWKRLASTIATPCKEIRQRQSASHCRHDSVVARSTCVCVRAGHRTLHTRCHCMKLHRLHCARARHARCSHAHPPHRRVAPRDGMCGMPDGAVIVLHPALRGWACMRTRIGCETPSRARIVRSDAVRDVPDHAPR